MERKEIKNYLQIAGAIAKDIDEYKSYHIAEAFRKTQKKIRTKRRKRLAVTYLRGVAAVLLLPLMASTATLAYLYLHPNKDAMTYHTLTSAPGTITQVNLPDQSNVWLNAGSTLRYPSRFSGKERQVYLEGQAYFRVEASAEEPFLVNIGPEGMQVKASGTRFDVCAYPEDSVTEVVLESGTVDVIAGRHTRRLHPNEMLTCYATNRKFSLRQVQPDEKTAWKDGRLLFRNAPLPEVLRKLSRRYNVDIELRGDTSKTHTFRATFTTETISQALDYIKMAAPLEWSYTAARQQEDFSYTRQKIRITLK
ncbi:MAG: DUF4974 domain-containing protein [Tannerellaceae bacterium]|jgi:ferric-dicitrate binding protein FerR (iron transport regulator)|nr:DUF4974 domain-containing protein [Tannerellaceae bacterium]